MWSVWKLPVSRVGKSRLTVGIPPRSNDDEAQAKPELKPVYLREKRSSAHIVSAHERDLMELPIFCKKANTHSQANQVDRFILCKLLLQKNAAFEVYMQHTSMLCDISTTSVLGHLL